MLRRLLLVSMLSLWLGDVASAAATPHPFYFGVSGGYGWTTWEGLVPPPNRQNPAMAMSTPTDVTEGGALWGLYMGYELLPSFAVEWAYFHYPNANVGFSSDSIFSFEHDGLSEFTTKTETVSLVGKILMEIPKTTIRAYSGLGLAEVHRSDQLNDHWMARPMFVVGLNYPINDRVLTELGANYTAGQGESELNPVDDYFPFLYSVFLRLAYRL